MVQILSGNTLYREGGVVSTTFDMWQGDSLLLTGRDNAVEIKHHERGRMRFEEQLMALDVKYQEFKKEKEDSLQEKQSLMAQFKEVMRMKVAIDQAQVGLQNHSNELKKRIDKFLARKKVFTDRVKEEAVYHAQKQGAVTHHDLSAEKARDQLKAAIKGANTVEEEFKQWTEQAMKFCEEVHNPRAVSIIDQQLKAVQKALEERERRHGATVEEMVVEVNKAQAAYNKARRDYNQAAELSKALKISLALYEFDVFMDAVNRHISMKMMIDTANMSLDKQYILITPQDMTNIHIMESVKVHRMLDPQ
ncbi:hypothetical protein FA15DRAFT_702469 [Coprinopsis marcescibilis]|uniref:Uncharacterized protein n=1 Tax=Coprinopsis marcescibilis TaxID=230819 RepID=A0A5C3L1P5_COPMA|nr:hypothetical protein FA15DRAFT_702469 [Coprinopsis marcescibilis]